MKNFDLVEQIGYHYIFQVWSGKEEPKKVVLHFDDIICWSNYMYHMANGKVLVEVQDIKDLADYKEIETERHEVSFTNEDYRLALVGEGWLE